MIDNSWINLDRHRQKFGAYYNGNVLAYMVDHFGYGWRDIPELANLANNLKEGK